MEGKQNRIKQRRKQGMKIEDKERFWSVTIAILLLAGFWAAFIYLLKDVLI